MNGTLQTEFDHLFRIEKFIASITDLDALLSVIMRETTLATDSTSCSIALYDEKNNDLQFSVAKGEEEERDFEKKLKTIRIPMGAGVLGWCASHQQIANIHNTKDDPRFDSNTDKKTGFTTKSILAVPMVRHGKLIGVVEAVNKNDDYGFTERDEQILSVLAAQASMAIENSSLLRENIQKNSLAALGQGIAGAAHCIKNIVNGISGGSYVLETGFKNEDMAQIEQGWEILKRNTDVMKALVLDMLSYSKPIELECQPTDINQICIDVAELLENKAREENIQINYELDGNIGLPEVDAKGLYRCILNLATNAVEACEGEDDTVTIITKNGSDHFEIIVSDTGKGIRSDQIENVFNVFFSTKGLKGTGLGLAITQKIIHEHGGTVLLDSVLGTGTVFRVKLPYRIAC